MGLFDFNRDGVTDLGESLLGFGLAAALLEGLEAEEQARQQLALLDELIAAQQQLDRLEREEPEDEDSKGWKDWRRRMEGLRARIAALEGLLGL